MNELKYQLTQFIFLILLGIGAYWALTHLDSGVSYTRDNIVQDAELNQQQPDQTANTVNNETVLVTEDSTENQVSESSEPLPVIETVTPEPSTDTNTAALIDSLEELISANVSIDNGDSGSDVGVVQEFLDTYFTDRTITIDNAFGPTTKGLVRDFQQAELNGGDGRVGPNTLRGMVEYLQN